MEPAYGVLLGAIQGLTEFLPVSSSGHLVLFQHLLGIKEPELFFDVSLHVGTLFAVFVVFRKDIGMMFVSLWRAARGGNVENRDALKLFACIVAGSVPTAVIGLVIKHFEVWLSSSLFVGAMLLVTGVMLWLTRGRDAGGRGIGDFSIAGALAVGCAQGIAVFPGISRSGATIAAGLFLGLDRLTAARFSFLLSIPAIIGAEILSACDFFTGDAQLDGATVAGTLTAFVVGYAALKFLIGIVRRGGLYLFAPYCAALGIIAIFAALTLGF